MTIDRLRELLENVECAYDLMDELYSEEDQELRHDLRDHWWQYSESALPRIDREIGRLKTLLAQKENQLADAYRPPVVDGEFIVQLPGEKIAKYEGAAT